MCSYLIYGKGVVLGMINNKIKKKVKKKNFPLMTPLKYNSCKKFRHFLGVGKYFRGFLGNLFCRESGNNLIISRDSLSFPFWSYLNYRKWLWEDYIPSITIDDADKIESIHKTDLPIKTSFPHFIESRKLFQGFIWEFLLPENKNYFIIFRTR